MRNNSNREAWFPVGNPPGERMSSSSPYGPQYLQCLMLRSQEADLIVRVVNAMHGLACDMLNHHHFVGRLVSRN